MGCMTTGTSLTLFAGASPALFCWTRYGPFLFSASQLLAEKQHLLPRSRRPAGPPDAGRLMPPRGMCRVRSPGWIG